MTWRKWREAGRIWLLPTLAATATLAIGVYLLKVSVRPVQARTTGLASAPLHFLPNHGQAPSEVRFMTRVAGLAASFLAREVILRVGGRTIGVTFDGASENPDIEGIGQQPGTVNFFLGNRSDAWITDVPAYSGVAYRNLYSGIDLVYSESGGRLKSEFVVAPGASPGVIRLRYSGAEKLRVDDSGDLVLSTASGELREACPEIYQEADGGRGVIPGGYRLLGDGTVGFNVEEYDRTKPLVIDPILSYSTYLGGAGMDSAKAIAVDVYGNAYVAGYTDSLDFPTKSAYRPSSGGGVDVFVAKLTVSGNSLVYCTYLGGGWDDRGFGIAVDAEGSAYVTGWTGSPNFPTTTGARQRVLGGGRDAFVIKLNASGNALVFSTFLGGASHDSGNAIAIDSSGNAHVAGDTHSTNFPVLNAFRSSSQGRQEAFAAKLKADGTALLWSTYLGGYGDDYASAIAVDGAGNVYLTGGTDSANFPTYNARQGANRGGQDAFVTKLLADGRTAGFSTYLGGRGGTVGANELGTGIKLDAGGNIYVAGITSSADFPIANALQPAHGGGILDAFVTKLDPSGGTLLYSTYLGSYGADYATGLAVAPYGSACVAGYTSSTKFPLANALQAVNAGGYDAFVARLNAQGNALENSTYWGGSDLDAANAVQMDPAGNIWIAGQTLSTNFPLKSAVQPQNAGALSAFVMKAGEIVPAGVFRSVFGNMVLTSYGSRVVWNAGGQIASDPSVSQNANGDTFAVARSQLNQVWLNIFENYKQAWNGWLLAGSNLVGNPAVAALPGGQAYVLARTADSRIWLTHYRPETGFSTWTLLGGPYASDPAVAWSPGGTLYVVARDSGGVVWASRYLPVSGLQGWVAASSSKRTNGRPALAVGADGAAYVAIRGTEGALWMARLEGNIWGAWYGGGGSLGKDPDAAATGGKVFVAVTNSVGTVYVQPFAEGTGNGWQGWIFDGGTLDKASIAAVQGYYFIAGKNAQNALWWYRSGGAGWSNTGQTGLAGSDLSTGPK